MFNHTDVNNWLERAKKDIDWVEYDLRGGFYRQTCFGAQQVAEKALKAYVFSLKEKFTPSELKNLRTHKLILIVNKINQYGGHVDPIIVKNLRILDQYYLPTRYADIPDPIGGYPKEVAEEAVEIAKGTVDFVKSKLNFVRSKIDKQ